MEIKCSSPDPKKWAKLIKKGFKLNPFGFEKGFKLNPFYGKKGLPRNEKKRNVLR